MSNLEYMGFQARVDYSPEDELLVGQVIDIDSLILFSADTVKDLKTEFHAAIDDYIAHCKDMGVEPQKPFKGTFNVRCGPELHRCMDLLAKRRGVSLNDEVKRALAAHVERENAISDKGKVSAVEPREETIFDSKTRVGVEEHYILSAERPAVAPDEPVAMRRRVPAYEMH